MQKNCTKFSVYDKEKKIRRIFLSYQSPYTLSEERSEVSLSVTSTRRCMASKHSGMTETRWRWCSNYARTPRRWVRQIPRPVCWRTPHNPSLQKCLELLFMLWICGHSPHGLRLGWVYTDSKTGDENVTLWLFVEKYYLLVSKSSSNLLIIVSVGSLAIHWLPNLSIKHSQFIMTDESQRLFQDVFKELG